MICTEEPQTLSRVNDTHIDELTLHFKRQQNQSHLK